MDPEGGRWWTLRCAKCGRRERKRVVFGYPSPELIEQAQRGEVVLGGCELPPTTPTWWCEECTPSVEELMKTQPRRGGVGG